MNNLKRMAWVLPTGGFLLLCIWHWLHNTEQITHLLDHYTLEQSPNFTIQNLQYRKYDGNGTMTHFLIAPHMRHIPQNDTHIFSKPQLLIIEPNQAQWSILADSATAVSKGETISLDHQVLIKQIKNSEETLLRTEHLNYYPQKKQAVAKDEVTITKKGTVIVAQGMEADLADNHIHFLHARGRHEPNV